MNTFQCPACGASLSEGSETCRVCNTSIDRQDGQPVVTTAGRAFGRVAVYVLIALIAALLVLAAALFVVFNT